LEYISIVILYSAKGKYHIIAIIRLLPKIYWS